MIDAPGPWGTGPFTLVEGASSILTRCAIQRAQPFACTWLIESEDRSDRVVLEANRDHWNRERGPRLERVVFRNDLSPADALEACVSGEGEVDIVTELSPADAARVEASEHAELIAFDANRVMAGIINRAATDVPLADRAMRQALNLAVDQERVIEDGLGGYATVLNSMTAAWCSGYPSESQPYSRDVERARSLLAEAGWPDGRPLRLATPGPTEAVARIVADEIESALELSTEVIVVPEEGLLAGARALVEKKLAAPWDVLLHSWFDLSSEAPPAAVHREFFGSDGAFRAGPPIPEFDSLFAEMAAAVDPEVLIPAAERIDSFVFDEALALFLCAPQALYAVNRHVRFAPYRTTFELAETEVTEQHWSLANGGG